MQDIFAEEQGVKPLNKKETSNELNTDMYKCQNCGHFLFFDPDTQKLKCEYCQTLQDLVDCTSAKEIHYTSFSETEFVDWDEVKIIKCNSCGAEIVLNKYQTATNCEFCGASNIVVKDEVAGLKPNAILPFLISQEKAKASYLKWLKKKIFAPSDLKKKAKLNKLSGIYIPVWTFDTDANANYVARVGDTYTVTVGSGKNRRVETRIRWRMTSGYVEEYYDDIAVEASQYVEQKDIYKIGGFDTRNSVTYHKQFISGYEAERYSKGLDDCWEDATKIVDKKLESLARSQIVADVIDYVKLTPRYNNIKYKYVMTPIWFSNYLYRKKRYGMLVNGRNGKTTGKSPLSWVKILLTTLACGGFATGLYFLLTML